MTITVDITPEVQAELARQAASHGRAIEAYAASLLEEAIHFPAGATRPSPGKSLREVFEAVRGLADDIDFSRNPSAGRPVDLS
jgi:plasmid stability protein